MRRDRDSVEALVITRNDPARLNACLWSIALQSRIPDSILIVNTGAWLDVGGTIDLISELTEVKVRRIENGPLGAVHANALSLASRDRLLWFFQDDAVAHPDCLQLLLGPRLRGAALPTVVYPDYEALPGEKAELPQEVAYLHKRGVNAVTARRGPCLGLLMHPEQLGRVVSRCAMMPMGIDDIFVQTTEPTVVAAAKVFHTRPERPRWNRIVALMKEHVLPGLKP